MRVWEAGVCVDYVDYSPPQLLSSSLKGINEQCAIQTNLDSKGFWLVFWQNDHASSYIYFQKIVWKNSIFSTGESVHIQFVNHQPSSYGSNREFLPVDPWSTKEAPRLRRIWWWEANPKSPSQKCAKTSWCIGEWHLYKTHQFFFLLVSYVNGIFSLWLMIEEKNQKMMVTSKFHNMVVLILLV